MKCLEIVRFELVYQLRRRSTWFFFALFMIPLIGVTNENVASAAPGEIGLNAPILVAEHNLVMGLVALLVIAAVVGDAATRDVQTRLAPLINAAPVSPAAYLGGRFLGAFVVAAMLVTAVPVVHILIPLFHAGVDPEVLGPFRPAAHLQSYVLVLLPNAFVATALLFALATLVRHAVGSYVGTVLVFAGAQGSYGIVGETLGRWELAKLLDSTGFVALDLMTRTWSPVESSTRLIASDGALLWNRLLWLAIACTVLALLSGRFHFGGAADARRWRRGPLRRARRTHGVPGTSTARRSAPVVVPRVPRRFGAATRVRQTLAVARDSLREVLTRWSWLLLPVLALKVASNVEALNTMGAGTPVLPTTGRLLQAPGDAAPPVQLLVFMLPVLIAGELVWRERDANLQALADAAPVPNGVRFAGKLLGLWIVFVLAFALLMLAGVLTQVWLGWYDFDLPRYVQILFGLQMVDVLVFGLLALSVHVLVNQKHVGHLVVLMLLAGLNALAPRFGIEHPLLLYGSEPGWRYSPISGFGPFLGPVLWFELYWAAWTLLLALVASLFQVRGEARGIRQRVRVAGRRFTGRVRGAVAAALGLVLLAGGFIFYNTNVLNPYRTSAERARERAEYERRYGVYEGAPQPLMTATELHLELHPDRRRADVRGVHHLENRTGQPIDTLHVATSSGVETGEIEFGRPARAALTDDDLGHRVYVLEEPLQPGDSLRMSWQARHAPRGFPAGGVGTAVVGNGSFIVMPEWIPLIGYQRGRELSDAGRRSEHGLPPRRAVPSLYDLQARSDATGKERIRLEVTVGTAADQIAVAPGELLDTWTRDGRRYFRYATSAPIGNEYAIFSADYAVREARWGDVRIEVLHHPPHDLNVPRMIRGMEASLAQLTRRFGPYPYEVLRMVEYPAAGGSLHAEATAIWYQELFSLFDPARDPRRIDLPFAVTAHEVAHQWWGSQGARVEGVAFLSESLAWYSAMGVVEEEYGTEHLARLLGFMRRSYATPRSRADVPLLRAADSFLAYRKGPFAMYALREYVGEERVDVALRRFRARYASPEPPYATTLDLYRELQEVTPDSLQYLLGDLFERNTFWELEATRATAEPTADGLWRVSLDVHARKVVVDTAGAETDMPMDDLVEIGVYAPAEAGGSPGRPLYLAVHRIGTGPRTITVTVPERPARAGIDPRHLLIDVAPYDNLADVARPGGDAAGSAVAAASPEPSTPRD